MRLICAIIISVALIGCSGNQSRTVAVPRPTAYPRIADPGSRYVTVDSLPVNMSVNASAVVSRPRPQWLDVMYPDLHVTLHISLTPTSAGEIERVIANRSERIALNVADVSSTGETSIESDGFSAVIITSPETRSTPLQFLAHDGEKWVISGAVFFSDVTPDASIDSLAPIVSIIERDLIHTLSNLTHR